MKADRYLICFLHYGYFLAAGKAQILEPFAAEFDFREYHLGVIGTGEMFGLNFEFFGFGNGCGFTVNRLKCAFILFHDFVFDITNFLVLCILCNK